MSDLRHDPVSGQWVAVAENRQLRPVEFENIQRRRAGIVCPFCPGHEAETPAALAHYDSSGALRNGQGGCAADWLVRVVPNKYPAFPDTRAGVACCGPYQLSQQSGAQEVIIQSPRHVASLSELTETELHVSFQAYRDRYEQLSRIAAIRHAILFANCRPEAGASLEHVHTQLIGTPIVTDHLQQRMQLAQQHLQQRGTTVLQAVLQWELEQRQRVLQQTADFVVFCPFASRFGYQIWIAPRNPGRGFVDCRGEYLRKLAELCQTWIARLEHLLDNPAYNLLFHFAPFQFAPIDHWYIELFPRLTRAAGFEWGTGCWVNPVSPETAAQQLSNLAS